MCNCDIFRTLVYSHIWYILKSKHIQSPAKYLRWSILLKSCVTIAYLHARYIQQLHLFRTQMCQLLFNVLVSYTIMLSWEMPYKNIFLNILVW